MKTAAKNSFGQIWWLSPDEMVERAIEVQAPLRNPHLKARTYVLVNVLVNKKGDVACAAPVTGHPLLYASAWSASMKWKFKPLLVNNKPVPFLGHLLRSFLNSDQ